MKVAKFFLDETICAIFDELQVKKKNFLKIYAFINN